jgi:hypothetical protein
MTRWDFSSKSYYNFFKHSPSFLSVPTCYRMTRRRRRSTPSLTIDAQKYQYHNTIKTCKIDTMHWHKKSIPRSWVWLRYGQTIFLNLRSVQISPEAYLASFLGDKAAGARNCLATTLCRSLKHVNHHKSSCHGAWWSKFKSQCFSSRRPDWFWGPPNLLSSGHRELHSRGVKRQGREADH